MEKNLSVFSKEVLQGSAKVSHKSLWFIMVKHQVQKEEEVKNICQRRLTLFLLADRSRQGYYSTDLPIRSLELSVS